MALRRKRQFQKPGPPELIALLLIALSVLSLETHWRRAEAPRYIKTSGTVTASSVRPMDYNAVAPYPKATISFEYSVSGNRYVASWTGQWPITPDKADSPPPAEGASINVFYSDTNPSMNTLYPPTPPLLSVRLFLAALPLVLTAAYFVLVYPAWKKRQRAW